MSYLPSDLKKPSEWVSDTKTRHGSWYVAGFFVFLFIVEWFLYFQNPRHFFQADSVFLLYHRATTLPEFLKQFTRLQLSGWYRPLSHQLFPSVLFPFWKLDPTGYRIAVYVLFLANTAAVYTLGVRLLRRHLPAALATFFFAIHTTNAFTTYDLGFMPELLYTLLYLCAVLAYIQFLRLRSNSAYVVSIACFIGSLLSKESAVTLPLVLWLSYLFVTPAVGSLGIRVYAAVRSTLVYSAIALVYCIFVLGYLHVQGFDFEKVFHNRDATAGGYYLVLDNTVVHNADLAASWAFNMPRGWNGDFRRLPDRLVTFLAFFRAITIALCLFLLFVQPQRRVLLFGVAWFFVTVLPPLPLVNHFLPYYLFLPIVGLSIIIGSAFGWAADRLVQLHWVAATSVIGSVFVGLLMACSASIHGDIENHRLLGGSANVASRSLHDLMQLYPELPPNATIYIDDADEPLAWDHSWGGLIKMAYGREDITVLYSSEADLLALPPDGSTSDAIVLRYRQERLNDQTAAFRKSPSDFSTRFQSSEIYDLSVSRPRVRAGDSFSIGISRTHEVVAKIAYVINNGYTQVFEVYLDQQGRSKLDVTETTQKGFYQFVGFALAGQKKWFGSDATITVE
jgi:hypothetical protein